MQGVQAGNLLQTLLNCGNWNVDAILKAIGLLFVAVGGVYSLVQLSIVSKSKRTETLNKLTEKYLEDEDIQKAVLIVSYDETVWYSLDLYKPFISSDDESIIDKMLTFFSYICYLKHTRRITNKEFSFFQYDMASVCEKSQTQLYLWDLHKIANMTNSAFTYRYLVAELINNGIINGQEFVDDSSGNMKYVEAFQKTWAAIRAKDEGRDKEEALRLVKQESEKHLCDREKKAKEYQIKKGQNDKSNGYIKGLIKKINPRKNIYSRKLLKG